MEQLGRRESKVEASLGLSYSLRQVRQLLVSCKESSAIYCHSMLKLYQSSAYCKDIESRQRSFFHRKPECRQPFLWNFSALGKLGILCNCSFAVQGSEGCSTTGSVPMYSGASETLDLASGKSPSLAFPSPGPPISLLFMRHSWAASLHSAAKLGNI